MASPHRCVFVEAQGGAHVLQGDHGFLSCDSVSASILLRQRDLMRGGEFAKCELPVLTGHGNAVHWPLEQMP